MAHGVMFGYICAGHSTTALTWKMGLINVDGAETWASAVHTQCPGGLGTLLKLQSTLAQLVDTPWLRPEVLGAGIQGPQGCTPSQYSDDFGHHTNRREGPFTYLSPPALMPMFCFNTQSHTQACSMFSEA